MPHLDEEDSDSNLSSSQETFDQIRPRTGSNSSLRRWEVPKFLRKKPRPDHGSEESLDESGKRKDQRVKTLLSSLRPRSRSDASASRKKPILSPTVPNGKPPPAIVIETNPMPEDNRRRVRSISTSENATLCKQMSNMYNDVPNAPHPRTSSFTGNIFRDMFRSRSHSDPKPRSRAAAIQARNRILSKQVRFVELNFEISFNSVPDFT